MGGWLTLATFTPASPVPFGVAVAVDPGGVTTASGNPISASGSLAVPADPGLLLDNPGFEAGLVDWLPSGAETAGTFCDLTPAEGAAQAVVQSGESLLGVLEVPADADALVFRAAAFSEVGEYDPDRSAVVSLTSADNVRTVVWDADALEDAGEALDCAEGYGFGHRVGPEEVRVDLAPYRGQTVFVVGSARGSSFIGVNSFALLLDDFRVE